MTAINRLAEAAGCTLEQAIAALKAIRLPDLNMEEAGNYELWERHGDARETWEVMIDAALAALPPQERA